MPRASRRAGQFGEWVVAFNPRTAALTCRHCPTRARLTGQLEFRAADGSALPITESPAAGLEQLMIRDARGDGQLYLRLSASGHDLTFTLVPRGRTRSQGRLTLSGLATVGPDTFACRTFPPPEVGVVQMASGPADSALNDSLFDVAQDTALRFRAEHVGIIAAEAKPMGSRASRSRWRRGWIAPPARASSSPRNRTSTAIPTSRRTVPSTARGCPPRPPGGCRGTPTSIRPVKLRTWPKRASGRSTSSPTACRSGPSSRGRTTPPLSP